MKKYRLKKWYPSLPPRLKAGMIVEFDGINSIMWEIKGDYEFTVYSSGFNGLELKCTDFWELIEEKDISEIAVCFGSAVIYLNEDIHEPTFYTTKKHKPKLGALNQLMILAEAWNSFDEFKPDWENQEQDKWSPVFYLKNGKIEFWRVSVRQFTSDTHASSFSFKTPERAEQFGKQFIDLFRIVLTNE